jgi:valyl-tRNA synthetase
MGRSWPAADESLTDPDAEAEVGRAIAAVQALRGWRDGIGAAPSAVLPARLEAEGYERTAAYVARLARCEWSSDEAEPAATVAVPGGVIAVLESDAVDPGAAARRIDERRAWLDTEIARAEQKLAKEGFVAKAPAAVVAGERDKLARLREERDAL